MSRSSTVTIVIVAGLLLAAGLLVRSGCSSGGDTELSGADVPVTDSPQPVETVPVPKPHRAPAPVPAGEETAEVVDPEPRTCTVRVTDADDGRPVRDATVEIIRDANTRLRVAVTPSDAGYRFTVPREDEDRARVLVVTAPGYLPREALLAADTRIVDVQLRRAPVLRGVVEDGDGAPVEGVTVMFGGASVRTDAGGNFRSSLTEPAPPQFVTLVHRGCRYRCVLTARPTGRDFAATLKIPTGHLVTVRALTSEGEAVPGADIVVEALDAPGPVIVRTTTGQDGRAEVLVPHAATYWVLVTRTGFVASWDDDVPVAGDTSVEVRMKPLDEMWAAGTVVNRAGDPVGGVVVRVGEVVATTSADGEFLLRGIAPRAPRTGSRNRIKLGRPISASLKKRGYLASPQILSVGEHHVLTVRRPGSIRGRILGTDGRPPESFFAHVWRPGAGAEMSGTKPRGPMSRTSPGLWIEYDEETGEFLWTGVGEGAGRLVVTTVGGTAERPVTIDRGETLDVGELRVAPGDTLEIVVRDTAAQPVALRGWLGMFDPDRSRWVPGSAGFRYNGKKPGRSLPLKHTASYAVTAVAPGFLASAPTRATVRDGKSRLEVVVARAADVTVQVTDGGRAVEGVQVDLEYRGPWSQFMKSRTWRYFDERSGEPVEFDDDAMDLFGQTDDAGLVRMRRLPPGNYRVRAVAEGVDVTVEFELGEGARELVHARIPEGGAEKR